MQVSARHSIQMLLTAAEALNLSKELAAIENPGPVTAEVKARLDSIAAFTTPIVKAQLQETESLKQGAQEALSGDS